MSLQITIPKNFPHDYLVCFDRVPRFKRWYLMWKNVYDDVMLLEHKYRGTYEDVLQRRGQLKCGNDEQLEIFYWLDLLRKLDYLRCLLWEHFRVQGSSNL